MLGKKSIFVVSKKKNVGEKEQFVGRKKWIGWKMLEKKNEMWQYLKCWGKRTYCDWMQKKCVATKVPTVNNYANNNLTTMH